MSNLLVEETSPYLLQHKDNPVHWRPWSAEALAEAERDGKPILLSVGYAACHWCHVMAHESFEDEATAALMNELFINIKVDREERPDVDNIYQTALALMGEHGGWPLTMFLTADGRPFWGGTYFPPTMRYGRPGFPDVLKRVSETYKSQQDTVVSNAEALGNAIREQGKAKGGEEPTTAILDHAARVLLGAVDPVRGGTSGAPKFPQPSVFKFLWHMACSTGSPLYKEAVTLTLDELCQGGIYDHLAGGFARYSTDEYWLVPHFEKMLYDNALLIELLAEAWLVTESPLYAVRIRETIGWLEREMMVAAADGSGPAAFASALDADSEGEEGKYYVWRAEEIKTLLGDDADLFNDVYDVGPFGNWEGNTILNRSDDKPLRDSDTETRLEGMRATLLTEREKRIPPGRDDKVLADWNGLMIAALARAGGIFGEASWVELARQAFDFVVTQMTDPIDDNRLRHAWRAGEARHPAVLDDYANMGRAALMLFEATGDDAYLTHARRWAETVEAHYADAEDGGYFLNADDTDDVILRPKTVMDNATPAGNGTMSDVLARLYHLTGEVAYRTRADALIRTFCSEKPQANIHQPVLLMGWELLTGAVQIAVVGDDGDAGTAALLNVARSETPPTRVVTRVAADASLPDGHPASGKGCVDSKPTAYVCIGFSCSLPATSADELRERIGAMAAAG